LKIKDNSPQFLWSGTPRVLLSEMWDVHCDRTAANAFSRNLLLSDYVIQTRPQQRLELRRQQSDDATKARTRERTIMEMPAKQAPTASSEIVMLIRKLRWVGLEEKAEQLEKELEQRAVTDTVVSIQNETD
jgi:hypothetical protein